MAQISKTVSLVANIDWDEAWANRDNSGSYINWYILDKAGNVVSESIDANLKVVIDNPHKKSTFATFKNTGSFIAKCVVCDGAMLAYAEKNIEITDTSGGDSSGSSTPDIDIPIDTEDLGRDITIPVSIKIPTGAAVFATLDCVMDIDISGSMSNVIDTTKKFAKAIVTALMSGSNDVRVAINALSTRGDHTNGYYLITDFLNDPDAIQAAVDTLRANAPGADEMHFESVKGTSETVSWRTNALKIYMQFTDEGLNHSASDSDLISYLNANNIRFISIQCDTLNNATFSGIATATGGQTYHLDSSASTIVSSIEDALKKISQNLSVRLVPMGNYAGLVKSIYPELITGVSPGNDKPINFTVTFNSSGIPKGTGVVTYPFRLEILEEKFALLDTMIVNISVNWG